ncbi:hypothetical protein GLOTRDRAFT_90647 [Gloeophyllum trabeum ATCC 11539]|uniref:Uncharacterized protein n=1 Tax=Gloeophyllum trabeum (strain ATCC 11539 / FP-39264 / Madison 617) TaxID=670483 RepID=S7QG66_GLOTA|nr:uncharacterized protein GLOTRDRAFT_90647 [Gloeophyllum trabeum ATCC 11539]EPQ58876.1 hypothetical protein GLOTRDRAFT_90647 [Gloeophyllum trabeum ATCC 11539]
MSLLTTLLRGSLFPGDKTTDCPLVDTHQLKVHLRLLRAFHDLRTSVQNTEPSRIPPGAERLNKRQRWAWFLHLAVERFERWVLSLPASYTSPNWAASHVPPIDVLLTWHAYMLNPMWYTEDGLRIREIAALPRFRLDSWLKGARTPFDPLESMSVLSDKRVGCPQCGEGLLVPFLLEDGSGYAQQGFKIECPYCSLRITKETLGVAKIARDLARPQDPTDGALLAHPEVSAMMPSQYLAGTVHTQFHIMNIVRAMSVKEALLQSPSAVALNLRKVTHERKRARAIQEKAGNSFAGFEALTSGASPPRIMNAYADDHIFSVELVGAVLRQESFIDKMVNLGWTDPTYFEAREDEIALHHAAARYHAFLDLMATPPFEYYVPTLDIDLAWHTHQLYADRYASDCRKYMSRFVDHDDKVAESLLSTAFDTTCRTWKSRFGIPYVHCGCPLPGDTIGARVSHLRNRTLHQLVHSEPPSHSDLVPGADSDIACAGTHPSDHNAVCVLAEGEAHREAWKQKVSQRRDKAGVQKGKMDRRAWERGAGHHIPFLVPLPMDPPAPCVATNANVVEGGTAGCATGMADCAVGASEERSLIGGSLGAAGHWLLALPYFSPCRGGANSTQGGGWDGNAFGSF